MNKKVLTITLIILICLTLLLVVVLTNEETERIFEDYQGQGDIVTVIRDTDAIETHPTEHQFMSWGDETERTLVRYRGPGGRVVIPDGITKIGDNAFDGQYNLTEIIMPDSVRIIGTRAFRNCINLTSVQLSENLERIGTLAFEGTASLLSITIPASVEHTGSMAFAYSGIRTITIMGDLESRRGEMFGNVPSLLSVIIYGDVNNICVPWFPVEPSPAIMDFMLERSPALTSLVIHGDTYNGIDPDTFRNHANLTIYGRAGSNLEAFARENNYRFAIIDDTQPPSHPVFNTEPIAVILNGRNLELDVQPISINGSILIPLYPMREEMGVTLDWEGGVNPTVTATKGDTVVVIPIGSTSPTINGQVVSIDQPSMIIRNRVFAPLYFVVEAFGATAVWNSENHTVYITK